jgi:N-acyl-D-amino-acid deacylase
MFDLIVKGGEVVDGTGAPRRRADVGVTGSRITAVGDLTYAESGRVMEDHR